MFNAEQVDLNSADFFFWKLFLLFQENRLLQFMQIFLLGDNLHEIPSPIFLEK